MPKRRGTGLAIHSTTAALTTSRALTSHVRRHYERRYKGHFRHAPWVFGFDMTLVAIVLALIGLNIYLVTAPPQAVTGVGLYFSAPPIVSAAPMAFEAKIVSRDDQDRKNVRLVWDLPSNTEIISASPLLTSNHEAVLGELKPGETLTARIVTRLFVPPGSVHLGFRIADDHEHLDGSEARPIVGSGLKLEPLLTPTAAVKGSSIPFLIRNDTSMALEGVEILTNTSQGRMESALRFETLAPFEEKVFLFSLSDGDHLAVETRSHNITFTSTEIPYKILPSSSQEKVSLPPSTPGQEVVLETNFDQPSHFFVYHPALKDTEHGTRVFDLATGKQKIQLPLDPTYTGSVDHWFVIPFMKDGSEVTIQPAAEGIVTTPFPLTVSARYYASTGDQLGIGPLPPRVGETTKYWVSFKLAPTTNDLSQLVVRAPLTAGVHLTGRNALPAGGTLVERDGYVEWNLPFVPASRDGTTANFEIAFTPTSGMKGTTPQLLGESIAHAVENKSGVALESRAEVVDTSLTGDVKSAGKGRVR